MNKSAPIALIAILTVISTGCATISTLNQPLRHNKPLVMSGTRLDLALLRRVDHIEERFGVEGPRYPLLDLPASVSLDMMVMGFTLPVATFKVLSNRWN